MSDVIHLLPDNVANQIAAGEVVQRPSSVLKELVENSIDAEASAITIIIKDSGRTLLQVVDNGKGMSETDARLCLERHATSKISSADDLFSLHTMGFRGEAVPSICSVSHVEIKSKRQCDSMGTSILVNGGIVESQSPVACPDGTSFSVRNIFFNVPARRKFLKSPTTEFTHIEREFFRIALVNPKVEFRMFHNDKEVYHLYSSSLRERIINLFGKSINPQLLVVDVDTNVAKIGGYIGKPETGKKVNERQYFFVNGRYMRHPYFHKAVVSAYDRLLPQGQTPDYYIYLEVDPSKIDVNIHPTKTEIKFEDEQSLWAILNSAVKESLGKFNVMPTLDFDHGEDVFSANNFTFGSHRTDTRCLPKTESDPNYNPFKSNTNADYATSNGSFQRSRREQDNLDNWNKLYDDFETDARERMSGNVYNPFEEEKNIETLDGESAYNMENAKADDSSLQRNTLTEINQEELELKGEENRVHYIQLWKKYIITVMKSGLLCIDQHRAHKKVLYERYRRNLTQRRALSQRLMFPLMFDVVESDVLLLNEMSEELSFLGFELSNLGKGTYAVNGIPSDCNESEAQNYLHALLDAFREGVKPEDRLDRMAMELAESTAIKGGATLSEDEMMEIVSQLFSLPTQDYTINGKNVMTVIQQEEIEKRLK